MSTEKLPHEAEPAEVEVARPALDLPGKRDYCSYSPRPDQGVRARLGKFARRSTACSSRRALSLLHRRLPITEWLPRYNLRRDILGDTVAGVTVAILHIPQGMGFALLANIPAICGIYMAFFPVIAYALLATSQHNSMGAFAIITMMTGKVVNDYATFPSINDTLSNITISASPSDDVIYTPIEVATIVCFMVGFWNVVMGLLSLGSVTVFFNDMLVSGFSTGAAVHVVTSQIKDLLDIDIKMYTGPFKIIYSYIDIFSSLGTANIAAVVISVISITVLALNNELLKPRLAKITQLPMPIELIVVIVGTTASYLANFPETFQVDIVGEIPTGLPAPAVPPFSLAWNVAMDSLVIAIVAYAGSYSLAKIFSIKHDYKVDANQELYAMGFGNVFGSFFSCAPMASAIARVLIQDSVGGVTQLACLITAFVILWVLLFVGPVFQFLPKACLASIIVVALKGMFMQVFDMLAMWKVSRVDALLWIITVLGVVLIDVGYGLLLGVVVAVSILVRKGQHPKVVRLARVPNTDLYLETKNYSQTMDVAGMVIVGVQGPLHFANRDNFKRTLDKVTGIDVAALKKQNAANNTTSDNSRANNNVSSIDLSMSSNTSDPLKPPRKIQYLVVDCQSLCSCDALAARFLTRIVGIYESVGIHLCLAALTEDVLRSLEVMGTLAAVTEKRIFHSVHDAVTVLEHGATTPNDMQLLAVTTTNF